MSLCHSAVLSLAVLGRECSGVVEAPLPSPSQEKSKLLGEILDHLLGITTVMAPAAF